MRPPVTLQALHNRWGEAAHDEAAARNNRLAKELLLANLDLFAIDDRGRLRAYVPPHSSNGSGDKDNGDEDANKDGSLAAVEEEAEFNEDYDEDDDLGFEEEESDAATAGGWILGNIEPEPETEYPSDDERRRNDGAVLASVLRRRITGQR